MFLHILKLPRCSAWRRDNNKIPNANNIFSGSSIPMKILRTKHEAGAILKSFRFGTLAVIMKFWLPLASTMFEVSPLESPTPQTWYLYFEYFVSFCSTSWVSRISGLGRRHFKFWLQVTPGSVGGLLEPHLLVPAFLDIHGHWMVTINIICIVNKPKI